MDYNNVDDNRLTRSIFIRLAVVDFKSAKSHEILRKSELIAVQGHPRSSILVSISKAHMQLSYYSH